LLLTGDYKKMYLLLINRKAIIELEYHSDVIKLSELFHNLADVNLQIVSCSSAGIYVETHDDVLKKIQSYREKQNNQIDPF